MTDWKSLAAALEVPLTQEELARVVPSLEALERAFRPLQQRIPHSAELWSGPGESE